MGYLRDVGICICFVSLWVGVIPALGVDLKSGWAYELSDELMSPYCPGRALSQCPSSAAEELRLWIIQQENSGASRDSVMRALMARYGDMLLQAPKPEGVGLIAYFVPGGLFLAGGAFALFSILRRRSREVVELKEIDPLLAKRMDEDLLNRDLKI